MAARYENYFQGSAKKEKEKIKRVVLALSEETHTL
jgi:hypothetical protein